MFYLQLFYRDRHFDNCVFSFSLRARDIVHELDMEASGFVATHS